MFRVSLHELSWGFLERWCFIMSHVLRPQWRSIRPLTWRTSCWTRAWLNRAAVFCCPGWLRLSLRCARDGSRSSTSCASDTSLSWTTGGYDTSLFAAKITVFSAAYTLNLYLSHSFWKLSLKQQKHTPNLQNQTLILELWLFIKHFLQNTTHQVCN